MMARYRAVCSQDHDDTMEGMVALDGARALLPGCHGRGLRDAALTK